MTKPRVKRTSSQSQTKIAVLAGVIEEMLRAHWKEKYVCVCLSITSGINPAKKKAEDIVHLTMNYEIEMSRKSHGEGESTRRGC